MVQRVRVPHRGSRPSSATQLPILTALDAGSLLCYRHYTPFGPVCKEFTETFFYPMKFPTQKQKSILPDAFS